MARKQTPANRASTRRSAARGVTFAQFEKMALALPGVARHDTEGSPLRVGKRVLSRLRAGGVLWLKRVYEDEQRFLMETQPDAFFLTEHHRGNNGILVRLSAVSRPQLEALVEQSWHRLASKSMLAERETSVGAG